MSDAHHSDNVLGATQPTDNPASKDPADWVTGDEPMTAAQRSYLDTLAREAGETLPADLTKAQASEHTERLEGDTGRGASPRRFTRPRRRPRAIRRGRRS